LHKCHIVAPNVNRKNLCKYSTFPEVGTMRKVVSRKMRNPKLTGHFLWHNVTLIVEFRIYDKAPCRRVRRQLLSTTVFSVLFLYCVSNILTSYCHHVCTEHHYIPLKKIKILLGRNFICPPLICIGYTVACCYILSFIVMLMYHYIHAQ